MFDIDTFIDGCESMKIDPWDYDIAEENVFKTIGKGLKTVGESIWSGVLWLFKKIGEKLSWLFGAFSKEKVPEQVDDSIKENFGDAVDTIIDAADEIIVLKGEVLNATPNEESNAMQEKIAAIQKAIAEVYSVDDFSPYKRSANDTINSKAGELLHEQQMTTTLVPATQTNSMIKELIQAQKKVTKMAEEMEKHSKENGDTNASKKLAQATNNVGTKLNEILSGMRRALGGSQQRRRTSRYNTQRRRAR